MKLQWGGRNYRPVGNYIRVYKPTIQELMKSQAQRTRLGSAILTGEMISGIGDAYGPDVVVTPTQTATSQPTPTPSITPTLTETPTNTPTTTLTRSVTPSSTPYPIVQPSLWFDASDSTTMNLILSGGTTYISQLTSKGTENWTLTGQTSDRYPTYSASTSFPGSPNIIRFTPNASTALRKGLVAFDRTPLLHSGSTIFVVWSNPAGTPAFTNQLYSGNTNGTLAQSGSDIFDRLQFAGFIGGTNLNNTNIYPQASSQVAGVPTPYTSTTLNGKFLMKAVLPANPGFGSWELNQSAGTSTTLFTGTTVSPRWNAFNLGCTTNNTQQLFGTNNNIELAEMMVFNYELSSSEQEAVELYLRDKWRYDEWASPVPTPTQTSSPTPSITPQVTSTPTPSSTPPAFSPSGITDLEYWFMGASGSSVSSWTNYGLLGGSITQGTGARQPDIITGATLGSYTGTAVQFLTRDNMNGTFTTKDFSASTIFFVGRMANNASQSGIYAVASLPVTSTSFEYQNYSSEYRIALNPDLFTIPGASANTLNGIPQIMCASGNTSDFEVQVLTGAGVIAPISNAFFNSTIVSSIQFGLDTPGSGINIQIHEYIMYDRKLSSTEFNNVVNYLKTKYQFNTW